LAALRLGVRIFFEPVHDASNTVFDERHLKVDERKRLTNPLLNRLP